MTGRSLVAWFVTALLAGSAAAQVSPVPPTAGRVTQVEATETKAQPAPVEPEPGPPAVPPPQLPPPVAPPSWEGQMWASVDGLSWWIQGARLPILLTTSPAGTPADKAGLAGQNTRLLFGTGDVNSDARYGGAFKFGTWLDPDHKYGVEVGFFMVSPTGSNFAANSGTDPILARPFINGITGKQDAQLISFPGTTSGSFYGSYSSSGLFGGGLWFRENIANSNNPLCMCKLCGDGSCCDDGCDVNPIGNRFLRIDTLLGYRLLRMDEHLDTLADITNIVGGANGPPGTITRSTDEIRTTNTFHGIDLGFTGQLYRGNFFVDTLLKCAFGVTNSAVNLYGAHTVNGALQPGGGFLVQPSNFGRFTKNTASAIPEIGAKFGYKLGDHVRLYAGYTLFYWFHVARPGDAIDTHLNPNFLNGGNIANGAVHPVFSHQDTNIWVQGVTTGIEFRY